MVGWAVGVIAMSKQTRPTCPKCNTNSDITPKTLLIGAASPKLLFDGEEKAGFQRRDQLAVDEVKSQHLQEEPLNQFVQGYYCSKCTVGFVPDDYKI